MRLRDALEEFAAARARFGGDRHLAMAREREGGGDWRWGGVCLAGKETEGYRER